MEGLGVCGERRVCGEDVCVCVCSFIPCHLVSYEHANCNSGPRRQVSFELPRKPPLLGGDSSQRSRETARIRKEREKRRETRGRERAREEVEKERIGEYEE